MLCGISGEVPQVPVVSTKSGHVYEKRLIEQHISDNGTEPGTSEPLTLEDLIDVKTSRTVRPRPPQLTSIPSLLSVFQDEWDALALETHTLRQNLAQTRQELSTALYQNDAAVRVIARLSKERDEARDALSKVSLRGHSQSNGDAMQVDTMPLPDTVVAKIGATQERQVYRFMTLKESTNLCRLMKTRRKRPVPEDWATPESISTFKPISTTAKLYPGSSTLALNDQGDLAIVRGTDGIAGIYALNEDRLLTSLKGGEAITGALWTGNNPIISTNAGKVRVYSDMGNEEIATFDSHTSEVTAITLHPSGDILASVSTDKSYALYDLESQKVLTQVQTGAALTCAQFHPDGHLLAAGGSDGEVKIFDVKSGSVAATFRLDAPIETLFFSENGTWLAIVAQDSSRISIWDLRKSSEIKSLETGLVISSLAWDYTGQYLLGGGIAGIAVQHYSKSSKDWTEVLKDNTSANAVAWGRNGQSVVALNSDGKIVTLGQG